jgi:hypothetical protein
VNGVREENLDASTPADRRMVVSVAILTTGLLVLGAGVLQLGGSESRSTRAEQPSPQPRETRPVQQAPWRVTARTVGPGAEMSQNERRRLRTRRRRSTRVVTALYNALFLEPSATRRAIRRAFAPEAARSFRRLRRVGVPSSARRVKTVARSARVTIEAPRGLHAVATVRLKVKGRVDERLFRLFHRATLWLARRGRHWQVMAYEVRQRPLPT